jgi:hypothetical protein
VVAEAPGLRRAPPTVAPGTRERLRHLEDPVAGAVLRGPTHRPRANDSPRALALTLRQRCRNQEMSAVTFSEQRLKERVHPQPWAGGAISSLSGGRAWSSASAHRCCPSG